MDPRRIPIRKSAYAELFNTISSRKEHFLFMSRMSISSLKTECFHLYEKSDKIKVDNDSDKKILRAMSAITLRSSLISGNNNVLSDAKNSNFSKLQKQQSYLYDLIYDDLNFSIRKYPKNNIALNTLGSFEFWEGINQIRGLSMMEKSIEIDDKDARSYRLLGDAYGFWGRKHFDPKKGEKFLLKAIEIDKNYAAPHGTLVDMFLILKKYDKAEKHLRAFLNLIPADQQTAEWCQDAKAELRKNGIRIL